jgi:hypothetical protein
VPFRIEGQPGVIHERRPDNTSEPG